MERKNIVMFYVLKVSVTLFHRRGWCQSQSMRCNVAWTIRLLRGGDKERPGRHLGQGLKDDHVPGHAFLFPALADALWRH